MQKTNTEGPSFAGRPSKTLNRMNRHFYGVNTVASEGAGEVFPALSTACTNRT
jgi:hypothetical protein